MENKELQKENESSPLAWFNKGFVLLMTCMMVPFLVVMSVWGFVQWNNRQGDLLRALFPGIVVIILLATLYRQRKTTFPSEMPRWRRIVLSATGVVLGASLVFTGWSSGMLSEKKGLFNDPMATAEDVEWFLAQKENKLVAVCLPDASGKMSRAIVIQGEWGREGKPPELRDIEILSIPFFLSKDAEAGVCCAAKTFQEAFLASPPADTGPAVGPPSAVPAVSTRGASCWDVRKGVFQVNIRGQSKRVPLALLLAARAETIK